ncbi:MAG: 4Fe-4S dicluster domain-containing protein [Planctomycetota bacterium]|jgi:Fe-S-cluster-containing dehydrogenase component
MKTIDRRTFLSATGAIAGSALLPESEAMAQDEAPPSFDDAIAVLYDATRCIGCRSCMRACREKNGLQPEVHEYNGVEFDLPTALSKDNLTVLQMYAEDEEQAAAEGREPEWSYIKLNCMHCNVPACASACPVAALHKTDAGPVVYREDRCIGCRYCLLACPFHVPRYEWVDRVPRVRKCDWNRACVRACPVGALTDGRRADLIAEAHRRIRDNPDRYVDHVYGEHEAGGTSYLILSSVEHRKLGLPILPPALRSRYTETIMKGLPGWIIGLGLFLGGLYQMGRWQQRIAAEHAAAGEGPRP